MKWPGAGGFYGSLWALLDVRALLSIAAGMWWSPWEPWLLTCDHLYRQLEPQDSYAYRWDGETGTQSPAARGSFLYTPVYVPAGGLPSCLARVRSRTRMQVLSLSVQMSSAV